jgi:hypothetical protein
LQLAVDKLSGGGFVELERGLFGGFDLRRGDFLGSGGREEQLAFVIQKRFGLGCHPGPEGLFLGCQPHLELRSCAEFGFALSHGLRFLCFDQRLLELILQDPDLCLVLGVGWGQERERLEVFVTANAVEPDSHAAGDLELVQRLAMVALEAVDGVVARPPQLAWKPCTTS